MFAKLAQHRHTSTYVEAVPPHTHTHTHITFHKLQTAFVRLPNPNLPKDEARCLPTWLNICTHSPTLKRSHRTHSQTNTHIPISHNKLQTSFVRSPIASLSKGEARCLPVWLNIGTQPPTLKPSHRTHTYYTSEAAKILRSSVSRNDAIG